jgi:hypothetical protein
MLGFRASSRSVLANALQWVFIPGFLGVAMLGAGCGSSGAAGGTTTASGMQIPQNEFGARFDKTRCDDKGKQAITADTNGDGKPDIVKLFVTVEQNGQKVQQLACRQVDLNHDARMDIIYQYGAGGALTMEEFDLDFDGKFDERAYYQDGKRVRVERDMDGDGKPDYTEIFEGGRVVRVERDNNGDGKTDEWQYFENGRLDRIGYDTTGSGRVDKWDRNPESTDATPAEAAPAPAPGGAAPVATAGAGTPAPPAAAETTAPQKKSK